MSCKHSSYKSLHVNNKSTRAPSHESIWTNNLQEFGIVDDYSRYTWVFFLHDKTEVASCFKKFAKRAQNKFEVKLKKIRSDNGKEFDNTNIEAYCDEVGIKHEVSVWGIHPRVPQDGTWAAPSEVVRPVRSRCARQDYKLY